MQTTLGEILSDLRIEWNTRDSLQKCFWDKYNYSPKFKFLDNCWFLRAEKNPWQPPGSGIQLSLNREPGERGITLIYNLAIRMPNGHLQEIESGKASFGIRQTHFAFSTILPRIKQFDGTAGPLHVWNSSIIICNLKINDNYEKAQFVSLPKDIRNVMSLNFKSILSSGQGSDVVLKMGDREFAAHRLILESRSPVFAAMFANDMKGIERCVLNISEMDTSVFELILCYMYSGEVDGISSKNVYDVYVASDTYFLKELKEWCKLFMTTYLMTPDLVCDLIVFAHKYGESVLTQHAEAYVMKHAKIIVEGDNWQKFVSEYQGLAIQLLECFAKQDKK